MRSARNFICCSLSSPETYNTFSLFCTANCNSKVDFPMPGSPPNKVIEPGTMPPPITRLNSPSFNTKRFTSVALISLMSFALLLVSPSLANTRTEDAAEGLCTTSSTNVFHSLHDGHLPTHLGDSKPQLLQKNAFLILLNRFCFWGYSLKSK